MGGGGERMHSVARVRTRDVFITRLSERGTIPSMNSLRIVELGTYWAAPLVGRHLRDLGCHVTAIVRPRCARGAREEAERVGDAALAVLRDGKDVLPLLLPDELPRALAVLADADVLVENYAPGTLDRLGLSFDACVARNPKLVYVSMPGFAPDDDEFRGTKAYEAVVLAVAGVFKNMGLNRELLGIEASYTPLPLASAYAAAHATMAALCAVYADARGRHITVPLASALCETLVYNSMQYSVDPMYMSARKRRIASGAYPVDAACLDDELTEPFFALYRCADRRWLYLVCPAHARHQRAAMRVLGVDAAAAGLEEVDAYRSQVLGIGCGHLTDAQARRLRPLLRAAFATRRADEWERLLGEAGVPSAMVRTAREWRDETAPREGLVDARGVVGPMAWLSEAREVPPVVAPRRAPTAACLAGTVVLDMCNVIAGPQIGFWLARAGADVIKIDPTTPTYAPTVSVFYGLAANRGKRSVLLDVASTHGRRLLERLMRRADVLLLNCTEACLRRLRLTRDEVARINPRLILARFDAWGAPSPTGVLHTHNGYDDTVQAAIGVMTTFGTAQSPEEHAHVGTIDVVAGAAGAVAVLAALLERERGRVCVARASLAAVGQYLMLPMLYPSARRRTCGRGRECVGEHAGLRCYRAADAWLLVVAPFGVDLRRIARQRLGRALRVDAFAWTPADAACAQLRAIGVSAVRLRTLDQVREKYTDAPPSSSFRFVRHADHPIGTLCLADARPIRGLDILASLAHAPKYGAHNRDVLGHPIASWSRHYVPFVAPCDRCATRGRRRFVMPCRHELCTTCASLPACPVCGLAHASAMREALQRCRTGYASWRRGGARGARDLERTFERGREARGRGRDGDASQRRATSCPPATRIR
ncbi:MAG: hypothetical protein CMP83_09375 [Gammaproteobacteria bacterium]|nr:hypothetical protein [Gammaproteobacteria bacterium]